MTAALLLRMLFASVLAILPSALPPSSALADPLTPPAVSGPGAFTGVWDVCDSENRHFRLTLSESNGLLTGTLEALDDNPQYSGTLTQMPETTVGFAFAYTYEQPATRPGTPGSGPARSRSSAPDPC